VDADDRTARKARARDAAERGDRAEVVAAFNDLLKVSGDSATYAFLDRLAVSAGRRLDLPARRLTLVASFTVGPLVPFLRTEFFQLGWQVEVEVEAYGGWSEYLLGATPDATDVMVMLHADDVLPALSGAFLTSPERVLVEVDSFVDLLAGAVRVFRERTSSAVHVATLATDRRELERNFAHDPVRNRRLMVDQLNLDLAAELGRIPAVTVYPFDALVSDHGRERFFDRSKADTLQAPIRSTAYPVLARDLAHYLDNAWAPRRKVVALDLDGTLWGGVLGEDGVEGIELGHDGRGKGFRDFQLFLADLRATGVLLALVSKNDVELVRAAFEEHEAMGLAWSDFAAVSIGWGDKVAGLEAVALELGLGASSFVFVDDSPVECEFVRSQLPDVAVVEVPKQIDELPRQLLASSRLEPSHLSEDDLVRNEQYTTERHRREERSRFRDHDEYLRSLGLEVGVMSASLAQVPRLAQLAGKTNQFNTTTIRYDEAELDALVADPATTVAVITVTDRFGSYGVSGLLVTRLIETSLVLECLLLSCRVLGRRVEHAVIDLLSAHASALGADRLTVLYRVSERNGQVADLLPKLGFQPAMTPNLSPEDFAAWERPTVLVDSGARELMSVTTDLAVYG
jgi:FkbH-like protein